MWIHDVNHHQFHMAVDPVSAMQMTFAELAYFNKLRSGSSWREAELEDTFDFESLPEDLVRPGGTIAQFLTLADQRNLYMTKKSYKKKNYMGMVILSYFSENADASLKELVILRNGQERRGNANAECEVLDCIQNLSNFMLCVMQFMKSYFSCGGLGPRKYPSSKVEFFYNTWIPLYYTRINPVCKVLLGINFDVTDWSTFAIEEMTTHVAGMRFIVSECTNHGSKYANWMKMRWGLTSESFSSSKPKIQCKPHGQLHYVQNIQGPGFINVRSDFSTSSPVIATMPSGTITNVLERRDGQVRIGVPLPGWISDDQNKSALQKIDNRIPDHVFKPVDFLRTASLSFSVPRLQY